jgi:hypothetical protein
MSAFKRLNVQVRGTGDRAMVFAHGFGCDYAHDLVELGREVPLDGAVLVGHLLVLKGVAPLAIAQFAAINTELVDVLDRHEIAAKNCAVVPAFKMPVTPSLPGNPPDWYEYESPCFVPRDHPG